MGSQCSACESEAPHEVSLSQTPNPKDDLLQNAASGDPSKQKTKNKARSGVDDDQDDQQQDDAPKDNKDDSKYFVNIPISEYDTYTNEEYEALPREQREPYTFSNGTVYHGEWKGNLRDGFGIQLWPDGARYEGTWKKHKANGKGKFVHVNGDIFDGKTFDYFSLQGNWVDDKANGQGTYFHNNGCKYEGEWKDDLQEGKGKESWPDGSYYEGNYSKGKKNGPGVYHWADKSIYDGNWVDNKIDGKGKYSWADGRVYEGEWLQNKMHGQGTYSWKDGRKYIGQYINDKKHGTGTYIWADGRKYEGSWAYGKQHGRGKYLAETGSSKFGIWENGKRVRWLEDGEEYNPNTAPLTNPNNQNLDGKSPLNHQLSAIKDEAGAIQQPQEAQNEQNPMNKDKVDVKNYASNVPSDQKKLDEQFAAGGFQPPSAQDDNAPVPKQGNRMNSALYNDGPQNQGVIQTGEVPKNPESEALKTVYQQEQVPTEIIKEKASEGNALKTETEGGLKSQQPSEAVNEKIESKTISDAKTEPQAQGYQNVAQSDDASKTLTEQKKEISSDNVTAEKPQAEKLNTESGVAPVNQEKKAEESQSEKIIQGNEVEKGKSMSIGEQ